LGDLQNMIRGVQNTNIYQKNGFVYKRKIHFERQLASRPSSLVVIYHPIDGKLKFY
jgi:hypothetical protein